MDLFEREGRSLVRLARLFVDDRNAAEDLVQEALIRLARSAGRIQYEAKAAAYLRSIVLNVRPVPPLPVVSVPAADPGRFGNYEVLDRLSPGFVVVCGPQVSSHSSGAGWSTA